MKSCWSEFFAIPSPPKHKRKHRVLKALEAKGFHYQRVGKTWEVWHDDIPGVTAIYDRLSDIPLHGFDATL